MTRLLIGILLALGLALSPAAADAHVGSVDDMANCVMGNGTSDIPNGPSNGSKMSCCTGACQAPSAAALLPKKDEAASAAAHAKLKLAWASVKELAYVLASGLDPPPRG